MRVINLNGTSTNKCNCDSWFAHWQRFSRQKANQCVVVGCTNTDLVGGHVQKDSALDSSWYIIPICNACNGKKGQTLTVADEVRLVSANVSQTCG